MTAQVGILNKKAIVLATDSAVTVQSGRGKEKVYNSVNKLFALSKVKPVGIMIYGSAELLGTPWETIIKVYRKQSKIDYKQLNGYANDFIKWLEKNSSKLFPPTIQKQEFERSIELFIFSWILEPIREKIKELESKSDKIDETEILQYTKQKISEVFEDLKKRKYVSNFNNKFLESLIEKNENKIVISSIIKKYFSNIKIGKVYLNKLRKIAGYLLTKNIFPNDYSGVVIAGFGDGDLYPSLVEFKIDCVFNGRIKYTMEKKEHIKSDGLTAYIVPFAQDDVIKNFMNGIHPKLFLFVREVFRIYYDKILQLINEEKIKNKKTLREDLKKMNEAIYKELGEQTKKLSRPIVETVSTMPIPEMCDLAESLVNLTSLRKKVTAQIESVGGETEVVSITKGEGFIWIKKKQYFDPQLNHSFINNYLNI